MKRILLYFSFLLCTSLTPMITSAQELTGEYLTGIFRMKTNILNDYIAAMTDKSKPIDVRNYYLKNALDFFVNHGEAFPLDSMICSGAKITIKSKYRSKPVQRPVKDYFTGLKDLRYPAPENSSVKIPAFPNQIDLSAAKQISPDLYMVKIPITREFAGYIDGTPVYKDITPYDYTLFYTIADTIDGKEYVVYFKDLELIEPNNKENEK